MSQTIFLMTTVTSPLRIAQCNILDWYLKYTLDVPHNVRTVINDTFYQASWYVRALGQTPYFFNPLVAAIKDTFPVTGDEGPSVLANRVTAIADLAWYSTCLFQVQNCDLLFTTGQDVVMSPGVASMQGTALALGVPQVMWRNDARVLWGNTMDPIMGLTAVPTLAGHLQPNHQLESMENGKNVNNINTLVSNAENNQDKPDKTKIAAIIQGDARLNNRVTIGSELMNWMYSNMYKNGSQLKSTLDAVKGFGLPYQKPGDVCYLAPNDTLVENSILLALLQVQAASLIISQKGTRSDIEFLTSK